MIEIKNVSKSFEDIQAITDMDISIHEQNVFGLLGTNGAGKSTLIRMMAGILKPEKGEILIDGESVWENPKAKGKCFYISDEQFFYPNGTAMDMSNFYKQYYPDFDENRLKDLLSKFSLDSERKIRTFSKGMKKQLSILLGICSNAEYLFCDETFDGLDPVMRQGIKSLFAKEMYERKFTPVIASHNLRELEDICDHIGLLHKGGVLLSKDLEELKCGLHKVQCVVEEDVKEQLLQEFEIKQYQERGKLMIMTVAGEVEEIEQKLKKWNPAYCEVLGLSLEEIFISETEVAGYDIKKLIL